MIRNFVNTWLQSRGYIKADKLPQWVVETAEAERWTMPDPQVYGNQADLYRRLSYIGAVVDLLTDACVDADFDITNKEGEEDDNHPFIKLLDKPNQYDSRTEFLRAHFAWRKVSGNSYWYLNRTSATVAPDEVWLIPPSKMIPVPDGKMGLRGYLYYPGNGAEITLEPYEVLHFKSWNPNSRYIGLSAIESLAFTATGALASQEWNTRLFAENNARLPGILAFSEMIQDGDWERMKKEVANSAAKRNNMMLRGVGKGGVEWMQAAATQREMEFLAGLQMSKQDIYDRLAPGLFSAMQTSALTNGENGLYLFAKYSVSALLREMTDKLNAELLPVYSDGWKAEYEDVVPEDKAMKMAEIDQFAKFHTIDEVRVEKFGNDPDPDKERGALLITQVTAKQAEPVQPEAQETPEMEQAEPVQEPQDKEDAEMKADLSRWKRKATKNLGNVPKMTGFESDYIPVDMARTIRESLPACKTADDVAGVFEAVKEFASDEQRRAFFGTHPEAVGSEDNKNPAIVPNTGPTTSANPEIAKIQKVAHDETRSRVERKRAFDDAEIVRDASYKKYADGKNIKNVIDNFISEGVNKITHAGPRAYLEGNGQKWTLTTKLERDYADYKINRSEAYSTKSESDDTAIKSLAASIDALVMQATKAEVIQPAPNYTITMPNINLTAQMPANGTVTVNVPEQPAPIVNVTTPETIVNVAPAQNNITVQPADVVIPPAPTEATITTDRNGNRILKVK